MFFCVERTIFAQCVEAIHHEDTKGRIRKDRKFKGRARAHAERCRLMKAKFHFRKFFAPAPLRGELFAV
jgi:hypothetical protein